MRKLVLGCAMALVAELAQADAYVSTYMTTECGFKGYMAYTLNSNKQVGVDVMQAVMFQWIKAVATSEEAKTSVMYPAFQSWYQNSTEKQINEWVARVAQYADPVTASTKERLLCEKQKAGELDK